MREKSFEIWSFDQALNAPVTRGIWIQSLRIRISWNDLNFLPKGIQIPKVRNSNPCAWSSNISFSLENRFESFLRGFRSFMCFSFFQIRDLNPYRGDSNPFLPLSLLFEKLLNGVKSFLRGFESMAFFSTSSLRDSNLF